MPFLMMSLTFTNRINKLQLTVAATVTFNHRIRVNVSPMFQVYEK